MSDPKTHGELVAAGERDEFGLYGLIPDNYICVDCGMDTWPGHKTRAEVVEHFSQIVLKEEPNGSWAKYAELFLSQDEALQRSANRSANAGSLADTREPLRAAMSALEPFFEKSLNEAASRGNKHIFQNWAHRRVDAPSLEAAMRRPGVPCTKDDR